MVNKSNFFIENYSKSWKFLKESKNFVYFIVLLFFVFTLIGFFLPIPESLSEEILKFIEELIEKTGGMSQSQLVGFIFLNNLQSSFFGMAFGVVFGIFPIISSVANGYLVGFVSSLSVDSEGILSLWRLLPHGIFELPAVFISLGMGLKIGSFLFQKKKLHSLKIYLSESLRVFIFIVFPLLIIAAVIEGSLIFFF